MRISDSSSDVCSSDLSRRTTPRGTIQTSLEYDVPRALKRDLRAFYYGTLCICREHIGNDVVGVCRINETFVGKRSRYGAKHRDDIPLDIPHPGPPERLKHKTLMITRRPADAKVIAPNLDKPNFIETTDRKSVV